MLFKDSSRPLIRFPLATVALLLGAGAGCNQRAQRFCEVSAPAAFEEAEDAFAFDLGDVIDERLSFELELTWQATPDWLPLNQSGVTAAQALVEYDQDDVVAVEKVLYNATPTANDSCVSYLETAVRLSLVSDDGALDEDALPARLRIYSADHFEIEATLDASEVAGDLEVSGDARLQPVLTVRGDKVSGGIRGAREVASSRGTNLRLTVIAGWSGSFESGR